MSQPQLKTHWICCNACGADDFEKILAVDDWTVGRCSHCSLVYVNPIPFFEKSNYSDVAQVSYYTKFQREITKDKVDFKKRQLKSQVNEMSRFGSFSTKNIKFLDVGCGPGLAVRAAMDLGWDAVGLDIDSELVELGRRELGVKLYCGDIFESHLEENTFTFIQFLSVLHLLPNPMKVLVEVNRLLSGGGIVSIVVPNQAGLLNQLSLLLGKKREKRFGTLVFPYHLHAFTPSTLKRLISRAGLKLYSLKTASPIDSRYAAIDQVSSTVSTRAASRFVWQFARVIGHGSLLVAYAGK